MKASHIRNIIIVLALPLGYLIASGYVAYFGPFETDVWGFPLQFRSVLCTYTFPSCGETISVPIAALDLVFLSSICYFGIVSIRQVLKEGTKWTVILLVSGLVATCSSFVFDFSLANPRGSASLVGRGFPFPFYESGLIGTTFSPLGLALDLLIWILIVFLLARLLVIRRSEAGLSQKSSTTGLLISIAGAIIPTILASGLSPEYGKRGLPLPYLTDWPTTSTPFDVFSFAIDIFGWFAVSFSFVFAIQSLFRVFVQQPALNNSNSASTNAIKHAIPNYFTVVREKAFTYRTSS